MTDEAAATTPDWAACAALVERGDPDRFLAAMSAPLQARAVLFPLYAFNLEVARAPWVTEEAMIAEMRLQWWRDAVDEIGSGKPARAHEVAGPLADVIRSRTLPIDLFDEAIAARRWDIYKDPFEDDAHFAAYLDQTGAHLMWLAAKALGAASDLEEPVRMVGRASALASWFQAIPKLEERGRKPLVDGRPAAIRAMAEDALNTLRTAERAVFGAAAPAVRAGWLAPPILKQVVANPLRVAAGELGVSEFRRRTSLMIRVARRR